TAFLTTPGHIYVALNTRVPARDYLIVHPDRDMLLIVDDYIWVPVEVTMLGSGDFLDAWRFGINEWDKLADDPERRGFYLTREAQGTYRPVGLRETDLGLQYGSPGRISRGFSEDFEDLTNIILTHVRELAQQRNNKRAYNTLGIYAARLGRFDEARNAFERASRMDSTYLDPRINLGSVYFLQGRYSQAVRAFEDAVFAMELAGVSQPSLESMVYVNLSKAHFELGEYDEAEEFYARAAQVDPDGVAEFEYLAQSGSGVGRASDAASGPPILFVDETEDE
ncbi:MAG: tetratricopeptide repeat protein, partial [Spirochaetaceae bacterium]|nr:tetratricopeptide repeat protein [Spirochaetaceae bacterium]